MKMLRPLQLIFLIIFQFLIVQNHFSQHFHRQMHKPLNLTETDPPNVYNDYFAGAGACMLCHNSMTDGDGKSVAIVNDWRSTMMANAAKDPFWKAKVSHEVLVNPHLKEEIETVCTRCHAPMGSINAFYNGEDHFTIEDMNSDTLGLDGVSCTVCHQITPESMGNISGNFDIGLNKETWGPYNNPFVNSMIQNTGYTPVYSEHIKDSRLCGSCHTLITNSLDLDGVPTGEEFVEQAIYQEWKNSNYSSNEMSCYSCHVPEITDIVKISNMPPWLDGRTPFGKHHFQGANVFMLKMLRNNIDTLGLTANETRFDSTINRTLRNLQQLSVSTSLNEIDRTQDSLYIDLELVNMVGHKLPGGYPSRRIFVELYAIAEIGDTIFHSGEMNGQYDLVNEDVDYEPHYGMINNEEQVQIYEMVMGDIENNVTTVLERAYLHLKDNRLPPLGFTSDHISYDTIQIVGLAELDENFNKSGSEEGTGSDIISYRIPIGDYEMQTIEITVKIHYQTVASRWLENMFTYTSEDIDLFEDLYQNADKQPVLMNETMLVSTPTSTLQNMDKKLVIYPNPARQFFSIREIDRYADISIYSLSGELIRKYSATTNSMYFETPVDKVIYIVKVKSYNVKFFAQKIFVN